MKKFKLLPMLLLLVMLVTCIPVGAAAYKPQDTEYWINIDDARADELLLGRKESFILFFYRDTCGNSQSSLKKCLPYAQENGLLLYGINESEFKRWSTWFEPLPATVESVGFPVIYAYNAKENKFAWRDGKLNADDFEKFLATVNLQSVPPKFSDVPKTYAYFTAIEALCSEGILNGYNDGTFKPTGSITRAEAAAVIARAGNLPQSNAPSIFTDVADTFWGKPYIMAANEAGIINGMGGGRFAPQDKLTKNQIVKMLVCLAGLEQTALDKGGWPKGYATAARDSGIIDQSAFGSLVTGGGDKAANRGQVAQWTYNTRKLQPAPQQPQQPAELQQPAEPVGGGFSAGGNAYALGTDAAVLPKADAVYPAVNNFDWHVFGTDTYVNFFAAGVKDGKIVALAATGPGFAYKGYRAGSTLSAADAADTVFLTDKNDNGTVHGVLLVDPAYAKAVVLSEETLTGESMMIFHCTNGFRVQHKMAPYVWSDLAATSAALHSEDMANNNYFSHDSLDGRKMSDRMTAVGIRWTRCAENIAAGRAMGIKSYDGWVNSAGHRKNILGKCTHLGVGIAYNSASEYKYYATQNFFG